MKYKKIMNFTIKYNKRILKNIGGFKNGKINKKN